MSRFPAVCLLLKYECQLLVHHFPSSIQPSQKTPKKKKEKKKISLKKMKQKISRFFYFMFLSFKANLTYFPSLPLFNFSGFSVLSSDFADLSTDFSVLSGISFLGLFSFDFDLKYQLEKLFPNFPFH